MLPPEAEPALFSSMTGKQCFDLRAAGPGFAVLDAAVAAVAGEDGGGTREACRDAGGLGLLDFEQGVGEVLFVPSNWWHQVENLQPTLSINHSAFTATNTSPIEEHPVQHHTVCMRSPCC